MKKISLLAVGLLSTMTFAQFNTLRPKLSPEKKLISEKVKQETPEIKDEKKTFKLFKKEEKPKDGLDIKNELDSLRRMLREYSSKVSVRNQNLKRLNDSLKMAAEIKEAVFKERLGENAKASEPILIKQFPQIPEPVEFEPKPKAYKQEYQFASFTKKPVSKISMPVNNIQITSSFGMRHHPIHGGSRMHNGIDLGAKFEPVYSVLDGVVTQSGWDAKGGGNFIAVKHSDKYITKYLHLNKLFYGVGDIVKAGYVIAQSGNTGNSTGPHLHFSVLENGQYINPLNFLNTLIKYNNIISRFYGQRN